MLLDPKKIDWTKLAALHNQYRDRLKDIDVGRRTLIQEYPKLLKQRKEARILYKDALTGADEIVKKIAIMAKKLKELRSNWEKNGGTTDNFFLNLDANLLLRRFDSLKGYQKEVRLVTPRETEVEYREKNRTCESQINNIKLARHNYRAVQRLLDDNSSIEVTTQYKEGVAHHYDAYLEVQRFQLSIRKETFVIANKVAYIKDEHKWYKTDKKGALHEACDPIKSREIERKVNVWVRG